MVIYTLDSKFTGGFILRENWTLFKFGKHQVFG